MSLLTINRGRAYCPDTKGGVWVSECTASEQYLRLCDLVGRALERSSFDKKVTVFVSKVQIEYNKQLDSKQRAKVWTPGRIAVRGVAAKQFSTLTWNLPRLRVLTVDALAPTTSRKTEPTKAMSKKPAAKAVKKDQKNGITRPKDGTVCAKIWQYADNNNGERAKVLTLAEKARINPATATTQFGRWRQYNGIVGRKTKKVVVKKKAPKKAVKRGTPPPPPAPATSV